MARHQRTLRDHVIRVDVYAICLFTPPAYAVYLFQPRQAQAEQAWMPGSAPRWFTCPKTVTHLGTNRA